jgi:hypothetical protein
VTISFQGPPHVGDFPPGEVWFEHATADGKVYYSHPKTQKTIWERPRNAHILPFAGEGCVIMRCEVACGTRVTKL